MSGPAFTAEDKLECARRELRLRERVYPRWVAQGRNGITQAKADREVALMRAIVADYEAEAAKGRLL